MTSPFLRSSKRLLRSSTVRLVRPVRNTSSTSSKRLEINSVQELRTQRRPQSPPTNHYKATHKTLDEYHFTPSERPVSETSNVKSSDPLQHVLDHPSASIILRDACLCSRCKDASTSQRDFNLADIPTDIQPVAVEQDAHGNWVVQWQNDMPGWEAHVSTFTPQQIDRIKLGVENEHRLSTRLWDAKDFAKEKFTVAYHDYMNSDDALVKTLYYWARHGLVYIQDVPEDEQSVSRIARRIGHAKSTFYGETWNIRSVPNATNVAFTDKYLGFHSDLLYMKEPPTVQFLHCIHNSASGGESRFVDQLKALDTLYSEDQNLAEALVGTSLRYEYKNDGFYYSDIKPIVQQRQDTHAFPSRTTQGAKNNQMKYVYRFFWGPPFLGSIITGFGVSDSQVKKSVQAMKKYTEILERDELVYQEKMVPGTCVMFDNLRVLHARNQFDLNTGERWLRGTYLDGQDIWSMEMRYKDQMAALEKKTLEH